MGVRGWLERLGAFIARASDGVEFGAAIPLDAVTIANVLHAMPRHSAAGRELQERHFAQAVETRFKADHELLSRQAIIPANLTVDFLCCT